MSGAPQTACIRCGCTETSPCQGGCHWVSRNPPICSSCAGDEFYDDVAAGEIDDGDPALCPASPVPALHAVLWVNSHEGYCTRCREPFYCAEAA